MNTQHAIRALSRGACGALAALVLAIPATAAAQTEFTDWTGTSANGASGTLRGASVTLTGPVTTGSVTDGSFTRWNSAHFAPPLATSDMLEISGLNGNSYSLTFDPPVKDPVLHLSSLASTLAFSGAPPITKLSGQTSLTVGAGSVSGTASNPDAEGFTDSNGSVQLSGTFDSLSFTATPTFGGGTITDGIYLQVGVPVPPPSPPPPPPPPPTPPDEGNLSRPRILTDAQTASGMRYRCNPGSWKGLPPNPSFQYEWFQIREAFYGEGFVVSPYYPVGSGPTYVLPPRDAGKRYMCLVSVKSASGRDLSADSDVTVLTGQPTNQVVVPHSNYGDVRVRGIDVFQVVQPASGAEMFGFPGGAFSPFCGGGTPTSFMGDPCVAGGEGSQRVVYAGVLLDQRKPTVARVYVDMNGREPSDASAQLDVTLNAYIGGGPQLATTKQIANPRVSSTPYVTAAERADRAFAVSFSVPSAWIASAIQNQAQLDLEARVSIPKGTAMQECFRGAFTATNCGDNNRFLLKDLAIFDESPPIRVRSVPLVDKGQTADSLRKPETVLAKAKQLFPGTAQMTIEPYGVQQSIEDAVKRVSTDDVCAPHRTAATTGLATRFCRMAGVDAALDEWWRTPGNRSGYDLLLAVHSYQSGDGYLEPGWWRGGTTLATRGQAPTIAVNDGTANRPLTAAAHEFGHALGIRHNDGGDAGGIAGARGSGCGGNDDKISGPESGSEGWPQDFRGRLQGFGYERLRFGYLAFVVHDDTTAGPVYDLMSYCTNGDDSTAWLSARNWHHAYDTMHNVLVTKPRASAADAHAAAHVAARAAALAARPAQASEPGQAFVFGTLGPGGGRIERVVPAGPGSLAPVPDVSSPIRVRALDAAGGALAEVGVEISPVHNAPGTSTFAAAVPRGAASVVLVSDGAELDDLKRSRAPSVRLLAPRAGTRIGARGRLAVRWSASDPDGDKLRATIDYASDGRTWRTVYQGPSTGRVSLPARFFAGGTRALMRVTVDDGFAQARTAPRRVVAAGTPPRPAIELPAAGDAPQTGRVLLLGSATDDRGRRLKGRALTWFAGSRRLGTGEQLTAKLPAGSVALRLVARDAAGRTATATRRLKVAPVALRFRGLSAPERVRPGARQVAVKVAATVPATLRAGGRSFAVDRKARTVQVPLPTRPATGVLRVRLRLTARGPRQPARGGEVIVFRG